MSENNAVYLMKAGSKALQRIILFPLKSELSNNQTNLRGNKKKNALLLFSLSPQARSYSCSN